MMREKMAGPASPFYAALHKAEYLHRSDNNCHFRQTTQSAYFKHLLDKSLSSQNQRSDRRELAFVKISDA